MTTGEIVPSGDKTTQWSVVEPSGDHYATIDEDHSSPDEDDYIGASEANGDDGDIDEFYMSSLSNVEEVSQIVVWTYGESSPNKPEITISDGVDYEDEQECNLDATAGWKSNTFAGLSWDQDQLDAMTLRYRADVPDKFNVHEIHCVYCVVTYTEAAAEVEKWVKGKVLGIPAEKIGKVMGTPIEKIAKIKGI